VASETILKYINIYAYSNNRSFHLSSIFYSLNNLLSIICTNKLTTVSWEMSTIPSFDQRSSAMGHTLLVSFGMKFRSVLYLFISEFHFLIVVKMAIKILYNYHTIILVNEPCGSIIIKTGLGAGQPGY
jgi:hypothetical protein